jgi:Gpi18-like mannosyltransferase
MPLDQVVHAPRRKSVQPSASKPAFGPAARIPRTQGVNRMKWPTANRAGVKAMAAAAILLSAAARWIGLGFQSRDYSLYLSVWYAHFVTDGRWHGLGNMTETFASYPPLYMTALSLLTWVPAKPLYAVKCLSMTFDYLGAFLVWKILGSLGVSRERSAAAGLVVLFCPTVVLNSSVWAQCDMMYTVCFLWFFLSWREARAASCMLALGLAISLKPQAVFIAPSVAGLLAARKLSWRRWWMAPAAYLVCGIPEALAGRPWRDVFFHWLRVRNAQGFPLNAPNWYQWVGDSHASWLGALGVIGAALATVAVVARMASKRDALDDPRTFLPVFLLSITLPPFLLPGMHERYFFSADVFSIIYSCLIPRGWIVALGFQLASGLSYLPFLFGVGIAPGSALAILMAINLTLVGRETFVGGTEAESAT